MRLVARGFTVASAGVDCIEHGYFVDDEAIARMKGVGCWLVITSGIFFDDATIDNLHSRDLQEALQAAASRSGNADQEH